MRIAVSLLSGGLDSTVTTAIAVSENDVVEALTLSYGQTHDVEIGAAQNVAQRLNIPHLALRAEGIRWVSHYSALTSPAVSPTPNRTRSGGNAGGYSAVLCSHAEFDLPHDGRGVAGINGLEFDRRPNGGRILRSNPTSPSLHRRERPGLIRLSRLPPGVLPCYGEGVERR